MSTGENSVFGATLKHPRIINSTFLFGKRAVLLFKWIFVSVILLGSTITLNSVLNFSDLMIGLMVIPNVIAIILLMNDVHKDAIIYFKKLKNNEFKRFK